MNAWAPSLKHGFSPMRHVSHLTAALDPWDDQPAKPPTRSEELAYDPGSGWGGGRVIKPKGQPLYGFWLRVAQLVRAGFDTRDQLAWILDQHPTDVAKAVQPMVRHGHLVERHGRLAVTTRTKRQLVAEARK